MARPYSNGYITRSQIGVKFGLKFPYWPVIQKALIRAGYLAYDLNRRAFVPTDKAADLHELHVEYEQESEDEKKWLVWSPKIVDLIRDDVTWVLANPNEKVVSLKIGEEERKPNFREYPDNYVSLAGIAYKAHCTIAEVKEYLTIHEIAKYEDGKFVPFDIDDVGRGIEAKLFTEEQKDKKASWWIWDAEYADDVRDYLAAKKEKDQ